MVGSPFFMINFIYPTICNILWGVMEKKVCCLLYRLLKWVYCMLSAILSLDSNRIN